MESVVFAAERKIVQSNNQYAFGDVGKSCSVQKGR